MQKRLESVTRIAVLAYAAKRAGDFIGVAMIGNGRTPSRRRGSSLRRDGGQHVGRIRLDGRHVAARTEGTGTRPNQFSQDL